MALAARFFHCPRNLPIKQLSLRYHDLSPDIHTLNTKQSHVSSINRNKKKGHLQLPMTPTKPRILSHWISQHWMKCLSLSSLVHPTIRNRVKERSHLHSQQFRLFRKVKLDILDPIMENAKLASIKWIYSVMPTNIDRAVGKERVEIPVNPPEDFMQKKITMRRTRKLCHRCMDLGLISFSLSVLFYASFLLVVLIDIHFLILTSLLYLTHLPLICFTDTHHFLLDIEGRENPEKYLRKLRAANPSTIWRMWSFHIERKEVEVQGENGSHMEEKDVEVVSHYK